MSLDFRSYLMGLALVVLGATTLCAADSREFQRRKAPPKKTTGLTFAEPDAPPVNTNAPANTLPKPTLGTLDDAIRKPFEIFNAEDSLNGALSSPVRRVPPPQVKNKRAEAKRERQKNWVFSTPEEIYGLPTPEELLDVPEFGPNGELKAPKTTFERYLERLEKSQAANATNQAASDKLPSWMKSGEQDDKDGEGRLDRKPADGSAPGASLLSGLAAESKRPTGFDYGTLVSNGGSPTTGGGNAGLFNFSSSGTLEKPVAKDPAREARMQEFKQMLDSPPLAGPSWGASTPTPLTSPATVTPFASGSYGGNTFDARPVTRPATVPSMAPVATTPSYFTPSIPTATATPATRSLSPSSSFELPKRKY